MVTNAIARRASRSRSLSLQSFPEFLGTGVMPAIERGRDMVVAVYVSKPEPKLSNKFRRAVPDHVEVKVGSEFVSVPTRIVDLGELEVS